jgi:hypothetical protein
MPEVFNKTPCIVEAVPMIGKDGSSLAVVIVKGTYGVAYHGALSPTAQQVPIAYTDEFVGEPGGSDLRVPSDLVDFKPASDVVIVQPKGGLVQNSLHGRNISVNVGPVHVSGRVGNNWQWGPIRRDRNPRKRFAGTYDKNWADFRMPLLPEDFDNRFNQAAPSNQQVSGYLHGDEGLKIVNLYREGGVIESALPGKAILVSGNVLNDYFTAVAVLDTVLVWTEEPQISLVWRHPVRLRQKFEELCNVYVYLVRLRTSRELYGKP